MPKAQMVPSGPVLSGTPGGDGLHSLISLRSMYRRLLGSLSQASDEHKHVHV